MAKDPLVQKPSGWVLGIGALVLLQLLVVSPIVFAGEVGIVDISEIRIDQASTDIDEFVELKGTPEQSLSGLTYLVIGDGTSDNGGTIEEVTSLSGTIPSSGFFVVAEASFTLGVEDQTVDLNFENDDTVTHLVVTGFTGADAQDLDTNDDGSFDVTPWTSIVDVVAVIKDATDPSYGPPNVGPIAVAEPPAHVFVCNAGWLMGGTSLQAPDSEDTPGATNFCDSNPPTTTIVHPQAGAHRSAIYNAQCGDGTPDVCGTAADTGGSGVTNVEVRIQRGSDGNYWNGSAWQPGEVWNLATGTSDWKRAFSPEEGSYILSSRATDLEGNVGSAASVNFTIDNTPPDTAIDDGPIGTVYTKSAHFEFSASPPATHSFECSLDGGEFIACTSSSSQDYSGLTVGPHDFEVRAIDAAGNVDPLPASRLWAIAAPEPKDVVLNSSRNAVPKGNRVTLTAQVFPCEGHQGDNVKFQKKVSDGWNTLATKETNTDCKAELRPRIRKRSTFRAVSPKQDADHKAGTSNQVTVRLQT